MTKDELRVHFDLKLCPNPRHPFEFGRFMGEWIWAKDCWAQLVDYKLQTMWVSIHTTKRIDGLSLLSVVVWKFKLSVGIVK